VARSACHPRSEREGARSDVARWIGSGSTSARRLPARRARRIGRGDGCAAGRRRLARPGAAARGSARAGGDRVDERRTVRARHARGARLGGARRRRAEGQGAGAVGLQDRQDRRARAGAFVAARPGAGDLAARPEHPARARARSLPAASGAASHNAQEPHPRDADHVRAPVPGLRPVRARRPRAAGPPGDPTTRGGATSTSAWR
jgi:hypothetical protein